MAEADPSEMMAKMGIGRRSEEGLRFPSYGCVLWMQLRDDAGKSELYGVMQESYSEFKQDLKVDPFRGQNKPPESEFETAARKLRQESAHLFDLTGEHEKLTAVDAESLFQIYCKFDDPARATVASVLQDSKSNFKVTEVAPGKGIVGLHLFSWHQRVKADGNKRIKVAMDAVGAGSPRLGKHLLKMVFKLRDDKLIDPASLQLQTAKLPTVTLRRSVAASGVITYSRV